MYLVEQISQQVIRQDIAKHVLAVIEQALDLAIDLTEQALGSGRDMQPAIFQQLGHAGPDPPQPCSRLAAGLLPQALEHIDQGLQTLGAIGMPVPLQQSALEPDTGSACKGGHVALRLFRSGIEHRGRHRHGQVG